jgi:hypothetical protein
MLSTAHEIARQQEADAAWLVRELDLTRRLTVRVFRAEVGLDGSVAFVELLTAMP